MTPMDNTKPYTKAPKPEIGRGCTFYYAPEGVAAKPCEGCYKLAISDPRHSLADTRS